MSPYQFIICAEGLFALLHKYEARKWLQGIRICNKAPVVTHMLFTDDNYVYYKANLQEADHVLKLLEIFEAASGQKVNLDKSSVFFSRNVIEYNKTDFYLRLGIQEADDFMTYLGLPNILRRKKSVILGYLRDRVKARIQG